MISTFEVGAKVTYEGHTTTIASIDAGDLIKMFDMSAIFALAAALPEAKSLRSLECAAAFPSDIKVSIPVTCTLPLLAA